MEFTQSENMSYLEAVQAFSEYKKHAKKLEFSCEHRYVISLTDFYLDPAERKRYGENGKDSTSLWTCYADGSFDSIHLGKFIATTHEKYSREQMVEMLERYRLEAAQLIRTRFKSRPSRPY